MYMRTLEMEGRLESLSQVADAWFDKSPSNMPVDSTEAVVARSLRAIGRLKINRYSVLLGPSALEADLYLQCENQSP